MGSGLGLRDGLGCCLRLRCRLRDGLGLDLGGRLGLGLDLGGRLGLDHGLGLYTLYFHLDTTGVEEGALVERGQPIGTVGSTGRSTGPHLHFGAQVGAARIDPAALLALAALALTSVAPLTAARQAAATPATCSLAWVGNEPAFEEFIRTAPVAKLEDVPIGVTKPQRATLEGAPMRFAWKPLTPGYSKGFMESWFHAGELDFKEPEKGRILRILERVPTIVDIYLERPAVIPEIAEKSAALLANFGASDAAVLDVIFGKFEPQGKLPFELPSSMQAVRKQKEDVPYDSEHPLFPFGHGLCY